MTTTPLQLTLAVLVFTTLPVSAATRYVDVNSTNPVAPYTNWATAANVIQDAVDAADPGDEVLVTNGVYATGGRAVVGLMTNRVAVTKPLTLLSVNGPEFTIIQGYQVPLTTNDNGAIRCVYLTNGASLSGFTLQHGATRASGDSLKEQSGGGLWCESTNAWVSNCVITENSALYLAGGSYSGTLVGCALVGNQSQSSGGGAYSGVLNNCTLTGNSAVNFAGGAYNVTLNNCIVYFNTAISAPNYSGGSFNYCCTTPLPNGGIGNISVNPELASMSHLSVNSPCRGAGSIDYVTGTDIDGEAWANPPSMGCDELWTGSVTGALSVDIEASYTTVAEGIEVEFTAEIAGRTTVSSWTFGDGTVVSNQPYASHSWATAGDYSVVLSAYNESWLNGLSATVMVQVVEQPIHYVAESGSSPMAPYDTWETAAPSIQEAVDAAVPGSVIWVTNGVYNTRGKAAFGTLTNRVAVDKPLSLLSVNGPEFTIIEGYQLPGTTNGDGAVRCLYLADGASISGFTLTNGGTRSTGDFTSERSGGGVWCESTNAWVSNCVITGCAATQDGGGAFRGTFVDCVFAQNTSFEGLGGGSMLAVMYDCLISNNIAPRGGGAYLGELYRCSVLGNQAFNAGSPVGGGWGGGVYASTLYNCLIRGNKSESRGGGAYGSSTYLYGCVLVDNRSDVRGGGASDVTLVNCIVYYNSALFGYDNLFFSTVAYSCTQPLPESGLGNITNAPLFVDTNNWSDLRLQSNSPCINAGNNAYVTVTTDLDGNPRIVGGTVDMGAYEFQFPQSIISYAWLQQNGLPTDGSVDEVDEDNDLATTWQEWKMWTNPTNPLSVLRLLNPQSKTNGTMVSWESVEGHSYFLERSTNASESFTLLQSNIVGQTDTTTFTDTNALGDVSVLYRVGVPE